MSKTSPEEISKSVLNEVLAFWELSKYETPAANVWVPFTVRRPSQKCPACARMITPKDYGEAELKVGGAGTKWPDILQSGLYMVLHERVVKAVRDEGFTGFVAYPTIINEIGNRKLAALPTPKYYLIEVTGTIDILQGELDNVGGQVCPVCFSRNATAENEYRWGVKRMVPDLETWDGSDFVSVRNWRTARVYCTKRFVDLACRNRWTNFQFGGSRDSLPGVGLWEKLSQGPASYHDPEWFEKASERIMQRYPKLFGLPEPESPPIVEKQPEPPSAPDAQLTFEEKLLHPKWDIIEVRLNCAVPESLKAFFADQARVLESDFRLATPHEVEDEEFIRVRNFDPIDEDAIREIHSDENMMLRIASDGSEGEFLFDPRDPEQMIILYVDFCDYNETGLTLDQFLNNPRLPSED